MQSQFRNVFNSGLPNKFEKYLTKLRICEKHLPRTQNCFYIRDMKLATVIIGVINALNGFSDLIIKFSPYYVELFNGEGAIAVLLDIFAWLFFISAVILVVTACLSIYGMFHNKLHHIDLQVASMMLSSVLRILFCIFAFVHVKTEDEDDEDNDYVTIYAVILFFAFVFALLNFYFCMVINSYRLMVEEAASGLEMARSPGPQSSGQPTKASVQPNIEDQSDTQSKPSTEGRPETEHTELNKPGPIR